MLSSEEAEKRLGKFSIKNWKKNRLAALGRLPAAQAEAGLALMGQDARGKPFRDWQKGQKAAAAAVERLGQMSPSERQAVFGVLFPKVARHMENAWHLLARLPYEIDYERKAFRAPNDPTVTRHTRGRWLDDLLNELEGYDQDVAWFAAWAPHLSGGSGADSLGVLLAAAIDAGGEEGEAVFEVLCASAANQHAIGGMGRHVTRALLVASRPDGWELIEKMLLAAQRQEGLRQVILESVDEAHPQAFRRMLRLILDNNLVRFSAVVRAADVWFGLQWDAVSTRVVHQTLERVLGFLEDPAAREEAIQKECGETLYLALWTAGYEDAGAAVRLAQPLLADRDVERRFVGVRFLHHLQLPAARDILAGCLDDEDLRIALQALEAWTGGEEMAGEGPDLFEPLRRLLPRLPAKPGELPALVWPWATTRADRRAVADLLPEHLGKRPATDLIPYLSQMTGSGRAATLEALKEQKTWDAATRDTIFALVGDSDSWVRERALEALKKCSVGEAEAQRLEALLTRKGGDVRRAVLTLLRKQKTPAALASAERLLASAKAPQRLGGLELLRQLVEAKRGVDEARGRAGAYRAQRRGLDEEEENALDAILNVQRTVPRLADAFGLMGTQTRSPVVAAKARKVTFLTPATVACLQALDDLIHQHRNTEVAIIGWDGPEEVLLGNLTGWQFPSVNPKASIQKDAPQLPLREVWVEWLDGRPAKQRDRDGLELARLFAWREMGQAAWKGFVKALGKEWGGFLQTMTHGLELPRLRHAGLVGALVPWLVRLRPPAGAADFLLDSLETAFALVPQQVLGRVLDLDNWQQRHRDWRFNSPANFWPRQPEVHRSLCPGDWTAEHRLRLWHLLHWRDEPAAGVGRVRPDLEILLAGYRAGAANDADVLDQIFRAGDDFDDLGRLTARKPPEEVGKCPPLKALVDRCRERLLEIELARGELPTEASQPAKALRSLEGIDALVRVLAVLGKKAFSRSYASLSRAEVLTHLAAVTVPAAADTPEVFAERMKEAGVSRERLLELAFLAPQWADHVERAVGFPGLREGVWWFLAHMPDARPGVADDYEDDFFNDDFDDDFDDVDDEPAAPESPWEKLLRERTPLGRRERVEGAADLDWFHRVYEPLGPKRWQELGEASKYGCHGQGYKKACLLADVLVGKAKKSDLIAGIRRRQSRDSVRLLGLLPLAKGEKRDEDLQSRYGVLQEYRRYARRLSPMSREGAVRAADVGLANLARTAGYPDPVRLEWAMEADAVADLVRGPVSASHKGVTVTLSLDEQGQPDVAVRRGQKPMKNIPAAVRKDPKVAALVERKTDLRRQVSRIRESLEAAMCRGDLFTGAELRQLCRHPILLPALERLVMIGEGIRGFPSSGGQALAGPDGMLEPVKPEEQLRLAHPHDMHAAGDWHLWQKHLFEAERVQPFKQVFRELYLVTEQERADGAVSHRYAGQQVNPKQALALWGGRGWATQDEVRKTFHDLGLTCEVTFRDGGWTPLDVEGWMLEGVEFRRRGEARPVPLADVPPRVFSEAMRDVDLVVSVAHAGGVDPEASASTVEMRAALLRETWALLNIANCRLQGNHVLIAGQLGRYSVHLASGVVHRQPGGSVCVVPVYAQHRGRLFLPFADDDQRTAEVISKVLLLARDHEIQDLSILEQIR
jgi:hypothetical protein